MTSDNSVRPELQLRDFLRILSRRKGILYVCIFLGVGGALALAMLSTPTFRSVARVMVDATSPNSPRIENDIVDVYGAHNAAPDVESQIGIIQSPPVLMHVFETAGVPEPSPEDIQDNIISIRQLGSSNIVDVSVTLPSKDGAYKVAQEIPKAYGEYLKTLKSLEINALITSTGNKVENDKAALLEVEKKIDQLNREQADKGMLVGLRGQEEERQGRLHTAQMQLDDATARLAGVTQRLAQDRINLAKIPRFKEEPSVTSTIVNIMGQRKIVADIKARLQAIRAIKTEDNPDVIQTVAELKVQQEFLDNMPKRETGYQKIKNPEMDIYERAVAADESELRSVRAQVASLTADVAKNQKYMADFAKELLKRSALNRDVELFQTALLSDQRAYSDLKLRSNAVKPPVTTLQVTQPEQASPRIVRGLIIGLFLGIVLGVIAALIRDRTDDRLYTLDQIQESCGILALGRVPQAERVLALVPGTERGQSTALESYRSLRFSLDSNKDGFVESVVLTSATAGEGRAEVAYNVAVEAARDLRRTMLVDADLRKPTLHNVLQTPASPGLTDYLTGKATLDEILHTTLNNYLTFIPAGTPHENPLALLTSPQMATLHAELQKRSDAIVFNSPSLLRYADGRAIAKIATSAILVAKKGVSRRNALRYCGEMLRRTNTRLLGVVLNDTGGQATDIPYFYSSDEASA